MRLAWGLEEHVGHYLSAHFPELMTLNEYKPDKAVAFVDENNRLVGAIGLRYDNTFDAELAIYVERKNFLTPTQLRELYRWTFLEAKLVRVTCRISRRNKRARRFVERRGFKMEGIKRKGFDGRRDACMYGMLREDCRWLKQDDTDDSTQSP